MATRSMGLTILVEYVFVDTIGLMDATTIKVKIPSVNHGKNPELVFFISAHSFIQKTTDQCDHDPPRILENTRGGHPIHLGYPGPYQD
jgi:hypothetical protein